MRLYQSDAMNKYRQNRNYSLDISLSLCYIVYMDDENLYKNFFLSPLDRKQLLYEALRNSFVDRKSDKDICDSFNLNFNTFRSIKQEFRNAFHGGENPARIFFDETKVGKREKEIPEIEEKIIGRFRGGDCRRGGPDGSRAARIRARGLQFLRRLLAYGCAVRLQPLRPRSASGLSQ